LRMSGVCVPWPECGGVWVTPGAGGRGGGGPLGSGREGWFIRGLAAAREEEDEGQKFRAPSAGLIHSHIHTTRHVIAACAFRLTGGRGAAQQLHPQGDALVPLGGVDSDVARLHRGDEVVPHLVGVVGVPLEDLQDEDQHREPPGLMLFTSHLTVPKVMFCIQRSCTSDIRYYLSFFGVIC